MGGESGSPASERRGGAGGRGHARQQSREAAAVSNTVAMATWPRGTGSSRNSSRGSPRRPAPPPPRARCHGDRPERGCAGGRGLRRPGPRMRPWPAPRGRLGCATRTLNQPGRPPKWGGKKKQDCLLFAFRKQPRRCSWRISWFPGARRAAEGQGHISRGSLRSSERWAASVTPWGRGRPALPSRWPGLGRPYQAQG